MKICGRRKVSKHKQIKGSDKYVTLDISAKFDSLNKMEITVSESEEKLEKPGKGLVTTLAINTKVRSQKYKKARYAIENISTIQEFEKIEKLPYEKKRAKHERTDSYFRLARQLAKCMMRSENLNWHDHGGYTEITDPSSNVNATDKDESK